MVILGALVNGIATVIGGVLGLVFKRRVSQKLGDFLMQGLGLCVMLVGVQGMVKGQSVTITVLAIVVGGILGYWIDIDAAIHRFGDWIQRKLYAKALIDMVVVMVMATTLGVGVPFSGVCVFVYEAVLSLAASALAPLLTDAVIAEMVCAGSLLLLAIGMNMLKITDIKVANFLPAAFLPIALCAIPGLM